MEKSKSKNLNSKNNEKKMQLEKIVTEYILFDELKSSDVSKKRKL